MMIDKIKGLGSNFEPKKTQAIKKTAETVTDNVQISDAAKIKADIKSITSQALSLPDKDANRIEEVKAKLKSGFYDNLSQEMLETTAENIAESFLG